MPRAKLDRRIATLVVAPLRRTEFPIDMLRYDQSWPACESESYKVLRTFAAQHDGDLATFRAGFPTHVVLHTVAHRPNDQRWQSFGWRMVSFDEGEALTPAAVIDRYPQLERAAQ
jgi:hypothetical protein